MVAAIAWAFIIFAAFIGLSMLSSDDDDTGGMGCAILGFIGLCFVLYILL
jgi:hypothetical protein